MEKTISIALATYNGEQFLQPLLDSLAAQRYLPMELVVSDDNSTDGTIKLLENFVQTAPFKVRILKNPEQLGVIKNFANAFANTEGQLIAYCDQDDVWHPNKLAKCTRYFSNPNVKLVMHRSQVVNDRLEPLGYCIPEHNMIEIGETAFPSSPDMTYGLGHQMLFDRKMYQDFNWLFTGELPAFQAIAENYDILIRFIAGMSGSIISLEDTFVQFRRHQTATSDAGLGNKETQTVSGFLGKDEDEYHSQGVELERIASVIENDVIHKMEQYSDPLLSYSLFLKNRCHLFKKRSKIYKKNNIFKRLFHYISLCLTKAYQHKQGGGFGQKAFFVDAFVSLLGLSNAKKIIALRNK